MASANVELVRSIYAAWERAPDWAEPDIEWHIRKDLPDAGVRKGHDGLARLRAEWVEAFDDMHIDLDELIDARDHVIAVTRLCASLRCSGQQLDVQETQVWKMRDGRAAEVRAYLTRSEALKAVGLE